MPVFFRSLRARVLLLIVIATFQWLTVMFYHLWQDRRDETARAMREAVELIHSVAAEQDQSITSTRTLLQMLAAMPEIRTGTAEVCSAHLLPIQRDTASYVNIGVTDAAGELLCAANARGPVNFRDRDWYGEIVKNPRFVVGRYVIGKISGQPILPAAYPIIGDDGTLRRIVWAYLDMAWLSRLQQHTGLPEGSTVNVLDYEGTVVARYPNDPQAIGKPHHLRWIVQAIQAAQQNGTGEAPGPDGAPRLLAFARLPSGGMYVSMSIPKETVLAQVNHTFAVNLGVLGVLSLAVFGAVWYLSECLLLRRIKALVSAAQRIARGDFSVRANFKKGVSELTELAEAFDAMAGSLQRMFEQSQRIMEVAPEAMLISDAAGKIVMVNNQTEQLFGYRREELLGQAIEMLVPERVRTQHAGHRDRYREAPILRAPGGRVGLSARRKDGTEFPVDISLGPLQTEHGMLVICAVRDMSERAQFESRILHQATHDILTGLPNRALFRELLTHAMSHAQRAEKLLAVLFLDLDGFKNINDALGHDCGDALLKEVATRLAGTLRKDDVVARQGGDEFTILLQGINVVQDIVPIAEKLLAVIAQPFLSCAQEMHVTASIGITVCPFDDDDAENLLRNADTAMYRAKETGKNGFRFYTAEMNAAMSERMDIETGLRHALAEGRFSLHYQPQIAIADGAVIGVEALLRWNHPQQGMIAPAKFIPIAEESGLIVPIGAWVLRSACRQAKLWQDLALPRFKVAVNLSARQFRQPDLVEMIAAILADTGLDPRSGALELEITESMMMRNVADSALTLKRLHAMGLLISIDDFGTGYSSLSYLKRFPIDTLKIDQSFVRDVCTDPDDASIAAAIVSLGHSLKLRVIAEGVETGEQLDYLRSIGCDEVQGYFFSRPVPPPALEEFLHQWLAQHARAEV
jgi:diguanylate cyclase (GGDEF)-like protein/PAS domain S-box-containing protein